MKKTILTILTGATLILNSCGDALDALSGGLKIDDKEGIAELKKEFESNFGDPEVYRFELHSDDHLTSEFGRATINYLKDNKDHRQNYALDPFGEKKLSEAEMLKDVFQKELFLKKKKGKMKLSEIKFETIAPSFIKACAMISDEYEDFSLNTWEFEADNNNVVTSSFTIEGTKKGEGTSTQGRNIVTNYYEFKFEMDAAGEITAKE